MERCWPASQPEQIQQQQVDETIREAVSDTPTIAESPLNQSIFQALGMGVGPHHAACCPQ
jgi:hypothetical protein